MIKTVIVCDRCRKQMDLIEDLSGWVRIVTCDMKEADSVADEMRSGGLEGEALKKRVHETTESKQLCPVCWRAAKAWMGWTEENAADQEHPEKSEDAQEETEQEQKDMAAVQEESGKKEVKEDIKKLAEELMDDTPKKKRKKHRRNNNIDKVKMRAYIEAGDMKLKDIAELMGVGESTVYNEASRIRRETLG